MSFSNGLTPQEHRKAYESTIQIGKGEGSGDVVYLSINCCISEQINNVSKRFLAFFWDNYVIFFGWLAWYDP